MKIYYFGNLSNNEKCQKIDEGLKILTDGELIQFIKQIRYYHWLCLVFYLELKV